MKTLILMRHGKSSWKSRTLDDHDRPLKRRGRKAALVMARWLEEQDLVPDVVLCSSARRTRETLERMRAAAPSLPEPRVSCQLYEAGPAALLGAVQALPASCERALLIGHQPGLGELLHLIAGRLRSAEIRRAFQKFPTAAVAVLGANVVAWTDLRPECAEFVSFVAPGELGDQAPDRAD